jgi:selenocysteine-specific elongation factor
VSAEPARVTAGTAGHIDHGKTALVRALTGRDTDRLAEEHRRGISIELGYAELDAGGRRISLVDVPGHERFVRTMIAGATGIDLFLLVVAADDGVMPQTREHVAVLRALGVSEGLVALTKCDRADPAARKRAGAGVAELLPGAPVVEVSAVTGDGLEELREQLGEAAARAARTAHDDEEPVLHVDRVFSLTGQGTIVTGTLWSGEVARGDRVAILPSGRGARVRSVQSHDRELDRAAPHSRVALNLAGVARDEVARGDVIAAPGSDLRPSWRLDVTLDPGRPRELESGTRLQVHHGTREAPARLVRLDGEAAAQLRLEQPLIARRGDRCVLRSIAPPDTLGGALVAHPAPRRRGPGSEDPSPTGQLREPQNSGQMREGRPKASPDPLDRDAVRTLLALRSDGVRPRSPADLAEGLGLSEDQVLARLRALRAAARAAELKPGLWFADEPLASACDRILGLAAENGSVSLAEVRDDLGTSRRCAQALLEHLDGEKALRREGDRHLLRRP